MFHRSGYPRIEEAAFADYRMALRDEASHGTARLSSVARAAITRQLTGRYAFGVFAVEAFVERLGALRGRRRARQAGRLPRARLLPPVVFDQGGAHLS
jgi:erythromycin esterase-like protein